MQWSLLSFDALTREQLYALLQLRSDVFVVEQQSIYLDADGKDAAAMHLLGETEGGLQAYARLLAPDESHPMPRIGRLVLHKEARGKRMGKELMQRAIEQCELHWPGRSVFIEAQYYLKDFYTGFGFVQQSDIYDMDGIEHIDMVRPSSTHNRQKA